MGLSSTVLWHQTKKDAFMQILRSGKLYYSYAKEFALFNKKEITAFPMISLCDLPLSEFASNNWTYGDFAIGLSRDWGIRNRVNPVNYCFGESLYIEKMVDNLKQDNNKDSIKSLLYCFAYLKPVQGPLITRKKKYTRYKFYDEREVRIVLDPNKNTDVKFMLSESEYDAYKENHGKSSILNKYFIKFDNNDIQYIIAKSINNITEAKTILSKRGNIDKIVFLSKDQVKEDIIGSNHNTETNESVNEKIIKDIYDFLIRNKT